MASNPMIVTSFAEIHARLVGNPVKKARAWHERRKNSYRTGQPCDHCGRIDWSVGRVTVECNNCANVLLVEHKG